MATSKKTEEVEEAKCDNHPQRKSVVETDGNGSHSVQNFCAECAERNGIHVDN